LDVVFVDATPGGTQPHVTDVTLVGALPLRHLGRGFVLLRSSHRSMSMRRQLAPHSLPHERADIGLIGKISLRARVAASVAHVHLIRPWLRPSRTFMEIRSLATKPVGGHHCLGRKLMAT